MSTTHLHLLLNHFPIIGTLIGTLLLGFGYYSSSRRTQRAALFLIIMMALFAIPVLLTGEPAEHQVRNITGISRDAIEEHEEAAQFAFWMMEFIGGIAIIAIYTNLKKSKSAKLYVIVTFIGGLLTFGLMARTGYLGGLIRHTEVNANDSSNSIIHPDGGSHELRD